MNHAYQVANSDIIFEQFDGDLVVLNLKTGQYFGFNSSAAIIWSVLMTGLQPEKMLVCGLSSTALTAFIEKLVGLGLVSAYVGPDVDLTDSTRMQLSSDPTPPTVEVYDDLADLIVADPIHDVDQATGWPHRIHNAT